MGLEWMALPDMDELIVLGASALSNATMSNLTVKTSGSPLQSCLTDVKATHGDTYGAIFLQSVPFGRNLQDETNLELQIDYTCGDKHTASHRCNSEE